MIKDLTYYIGNAGVDLKDKNDNRTDIDIAAFSYQDAKYIRKEIQVNNEDLYYIYLYVTVYATNERELNFSLNKIEGILQSSGLITRRATFRQEQLFKACLPIMENSSDIKEISKRNILTSGLISTYPFISANIFDETGIFLGTNIYNNSLVFVDRFNKEKYKNANMCVFGASGAGKSFFIKVQLLRYWMMGIEQYVIDPEREYDKLAEKLGGTIIKIGPSSSTYINVLDIREESIEDSAGFLSTKLNKLKGFFSLIFENMTDDKYTVLEEKIIKIYGMKGITFDDKSLYENGVFKSSEKMPILEDLYNEFSDEDNYFKPKLKLFVNGSLSFFNKKTNVNLENRLIVADIYELGEENLKLGMFIFTELFWDKIKKERNKQKAIYLDEIWRLIGVVSNKEVASFIYKIFKTIRKFGGSSVAITQDISDLFSLDDGVFGRSILNNSNIKAFFSLEEENLLVLEKYTNISEKEKIEIKSLKRGECLMFVEDNHILVNIEASDFEKNLLL
ncbi:MAG: DUF87 domain-containing protein [Clostridia bacterium]|nr:DUF87 domain-containing protein [Clostridia bacterium]